MWTFQSLAEVRWLSELPNELSSGFGRQKVGREGIADVQEPFNATGAVDSRLPLRRFIVGGLSAKSALLAYEQGAPEHNFQRYHARSYVLDDSGWRQTGEWTLHTYPFTLRDLIWGVRFAAGDSGVQRLLRVSERIEKTRPARRNNPLREANLSDEEVREIQAAAYGVVPDALVNISGVVTGCPCEEGVGCTDQVWIVAYRPGLMKGLQLSRINGRWTIGSVQQWWLELENLDDHRANFASWADFLTEREKLSDKFPACVGETSAPAQATASPRSRN